MKILKKIIPLLLIAFLLIPLGNAFASTNLTLRGSSGVTNVGYLYDGNPNTAATFGKQGYASLNLPVNNGTRTWAIGTGHPTVNIEFYNAANTKLVTYNAASKRSGEVPDDATYVRIHYATDFDTTTTISEFDVAGKSDVTNIQVANITAHTADIAWVNPTNISGGVTHVSTDIYYDGAVQANVPTTQTSYKLTNLKSNTNYTVHVLARYSDGTSVIRRTTNSKSFTTALEDPKEISAVDVKAEYNRVNLSWVLPEQDIFKHVNIYRTKIEEPGIMSYLAGSTVYAAEAGTKIFETNGTYFNDLTVEPESTYEYTLTTQTTDGRESEGVTVQATTSEEPVPVMEGLAYTVNEDGDYVYTWEEPTKGTVNLLINGQVYKAVPSSEGSVTVPKEDVTLNGFGDPKISFQPIGEFGTEGKIYTSKGGNLVTPFSVIDLINSGMGLMKFVAPFLLLSLSFILVPRFRKLIIQALGRFRKDKNVGLERRSQEVPRDRHEGKEYLEKKERIEREHQERESRERIERENKEIKVITEKTPREQTRQSRERLEKPSKRLRGVKQPRAERTPRERNRQPREQRERRTRRE